MVQRDFVVVAADEGANSARGQRVVLDGSDPSAVDGEAQRIADGPHQQVVRRAAWADAARARPGHQVDPVVADATPGAEFAQIAGLEHVGIRLLIQTVAGEWALIAHDHAVAAPGRATRLAERRRNDDVGRALDKRYRDGHELGRLTG